MVYISGKKKSFYQRKWWDRVICFDL